MSCLRKAAILGFVTGLVGLGVSFIPVIFNLEDKPIKPLNFYEHLAALFFWGLVIGFFCRLFRTMVAAIGIIGGSVAYLLIISYQFKAEGNWFPLFVPFFLQNPFAFFSAVVWKYLETSRERQDITKAFGYYLPDKVVDKLAKNVSNLKATNQRVYGICLYTDAEKYTSLSETMDPEDLGEFMNAYYEALFEPMKKYGGICRESLERFGEDGPSLFYLKLCELYKTSPPGELWDGVICLSGK